MSENSLLDVSVKYCRERQKKLLEVMQRQRLDLVIFTKIENMQWLVGPRFNWYHEPAAALWADGRVTLVAPNKAPDEAAADDVRIYEANSTSTLRNDQRQKSSAVLVDAIFAHRKPQRVGVEFSCCSQHITKPLGGELIDIEPAHYELRRFKYPDELARLKKAIGATGLMYAKARQIITPGVNELEVFSELQRIAVRECGEMLTGTGNDYQSGMRGGPPRDRKVEAGELYILDLGPAYRGYFADNARVICVGGKPTARQQEAWATISGTFKFIEAMIKPGVSAKKVYELTKQIIGRFHGGWWRSHLGHGIGLFPHEAPHLNPNWDDKFAEGDVIAVEPAVYAEEELRVGIRLENNYRVTTTGVELLSDFPMGLV